jgi:hypothetical protein
MQNQPSSDLFDIAENVPQPRKVWLNVYSRESGFRPTFAFGSIEEARGSGFPKDCILCVDLDTLAVTKEAA